MKDILDKFKNKNCIVTGGAGFIGQNLVTKLLDLGAKVVVIDNLSFGAQKEAIDFRAVFVKANVVDQQSFASLPDLNYDFIFHFAAPSSIILFKENLSQAVDITVQGFLNAVDFARQHNIKLIYPSTGSLYSHAPTPHVETAALALDSLNTYARVKFVLEHLAKVYEAELDSLGLRIFAGYGSSEKHKGHFASVAYMFCQQMKKGVSPEIWGDGRQSRDFVFIDDIVNITLTLTLEAQEKVVNIGSGQAVEFNRLVSIINKKIDTNIKPKYIERPNLYLDKSQADTSLMKKYYTAPLTSIEEGITTIIDSL